MIDLQAFGRFELPSLRRSRSPQQRASAIPQVRYIIETTTNSSLRTVRDQVLTILGDKSNISSKARVKHVTVEPLFPGANSTPAKYRLRRFFRVAIPIQEEHLLLNVRGRAVLWEISYALKAGMKQVRSVRPALPYRNQAAILPLSSITCGVKNQHAPRDRSWSLRVTRFTEIENLSGTVPGKPVPGRGITIAHLDTGYTDHSAFDMGHFNLANDRNFNEETNDARDPLINPLPFGTATPGHGTATASVIMGTGRIERWQDHFVGTIGLNLHGQVNVQNSVGTLDQGGNSYNFNANSNLPFNPPVAGAAPGVTLLPIRCIYGVTHLGQTDNTEGDFFSWDRVAEGIFHAATHGADIVTMSFGGPFTEEALQQVMQFAVEDRQMILCAAAGNCAEAVVFPALDNNCIAVAGMGIAEIKGVNSTTDHPTNEDLWHPWTATCRGKKVDISAPAENVWHAMYSSNWLQPDPQEIAQPGEGTSFAAPYVAAAAALWLEGKGGRWAILDSSRNGGLDYSGKTLQNIFREALRKSANTRGGRWDTDKFGAGVLDVEQLLAILLPDPDSVADPDLNNTNSIDVLCGLVDGMSCSQIQEALAEFLNIAVAELQNWLQEFGSELNSLLFETAESTRRFLDWLSAWDASSVGNQIAEATQALADDIASKASDTLSQAAGWLGL